jgi:hypothetical protein
LRLGGGLLLALAHAFRRALADHAFDEKGDDAFAFWGCAYFGAWREDAQFGVGGDLFDHLDGLRPVVAVVCGFGEVEAGDLEAVEEQAGAARVDVVGGDAAENFADGQLNAGTIVGIGQGKFEGGAAAPTLPGVGDGAPGGVVVVAEVLSA